MKTTVQLILCFLPLVVHCRFLVISRTQDTKLRVSGRILCQVDDGETYPVEFAAVQLTGAGFFSKEYGSTQSNSLGAFTIEVDSSEVSSRLNIEVEYKYSGSYGRMEVEAELFGWNRIDTMPIEQYSGSSINVSNVMFENDHCRAYVMTYLAMRDYSMRTGGKSLPYDELKVVTKAPIHAGTPYTTTNKIRIPSGYRYGYKTALHELAHTVRHSLDGSFAHFLVDVVRYKYAQHHYCGQRTNEGFAFNEGWASFWEGGCLESYYGNRPSDYTIEGNVAVSIRVMMLRCGSTYRQLVEVLEKNKGGIHSYEEYARAHNDMYDCM